MLLLHRLLLAVLLLLATPAWAQTPPTGFATVSGTAWTQGGGVAGPASGFGITRWNTPFGPDQKAQCVIATLPADGGTGLGINIRIEDSSNRYRVEVHRVVGSNNDTLTLSKIAAGVTTTLAGPANLGVDIAVGDAIGAKIVSNAITGTANLAAWAEYRDIVTGTATTTPASSYVGVGAENPATCTSFGAEGDAVGGDTTPPTPDPPTGVVATTLSQTEISLTSGVCTDDIGVISYKDERGLVSNCSDCVQIRATNAVTFIDSGLTANTTYYYRRRCNDGTNDSTTYSAIFSATTFSSADTTAPTAPTVLGVSRTTGSDATRNDMRLTWTAPTDTGGSGVNVIEIEQGDGACANFVAIGTVGPVTAFDGVDLDILLTATLSFQARAIDLAGNVGSYSSCVLLHPVSGGRIR